MKQNVILLFAVAFCVVLFSRCKKDDPDPIVVTQAMLDETTSLFKNLTGAQNGQNFAHGGPTNGGDATIRDIYTADGNAPKIEPGTVITKHTFANDDDAKGNLFVIFAMVKHQKGYWPETNDWEYIQMPNPNDGSVDYTLNPNGILAKAAISGNTGEELPGCVGCHSLALGDDQLFSND